IPISKTARGMNDQKSPLEHALTDGEDFELVFASPPDQARALIERQPIPGITLVHIGEFVDRGMWLEMAGHLVPLVPRGYTHELRYRLRRPLVGLHYVLGIRSLIL